MGEALLGSKGKDRFRAFSAGSLRIDTLGTLALQQQLDDIGRAGPDE